MTKSIRAVLALIAALGCAGWVVEAAADELPSYKPPMRGAPGGRLSGASRGVEAGSLPTIEPLAPDGVAGQSASPTPTLYYFISRAPTQPLRLTVRQPNVAQMLVDTPLPAPRGAGIQAVRLSDYRAQLQPGATYVWSVSLVLDPNTPSKNIVASATIVYAALDPATDSATRGQPPLRRAALLAQAGFWYDAIAAAVEGAATDRHAALDALLDQVGLRNAAAADRATAR